MRIIILYLFVLFCSTGMAQKQTISGTITDAGNGEVLIGANVYVTALDIGVTTNNYGFVEK